MCQKIFKSKTVKSIKFSKPLAKYLLPNSPILFLYYNINIIEIFFNIIFLKENKK